MGSATVRPERQGLTVEGGAVLYGALVSASTMVVAGAHADDYRSIAASTTGAVVVFWLAHVYIHAQTGYDGERPGLLRRLREGAASEVGVLVGGVPAVAVYVAAVLLGVTRAEAATVAVWFSVVLLLGTGWSTARRAGARGPALVIETVAAGLLGIMVVIGKALLH